MGTSNEINGVLVNTLFGILAKKISTPTEFHDQVNAIKTMLSNDVTGLIDSLSDFLVTSAKVNYQVQTGNENFNKILKKWSVQVVNSDYLGRIPRGINALAEEYFKERWKSSSFPILKILDWKIVDGIKLPSKMFFVDGGSVWVDDTDNSLKLGTYKYYLGKGKNDELNKGIIFTKPFARWFDVYPTPFMIKRGIYTNFRIVESLKTKQSELLNQVIPYMFLLKKGSEALALAELKSNSGKIYSNNELTNIIQDIKDMIEDGFDSYKAQMNARATQWDEEIKHLIPDLDPMFKASLFTAAEKAILGGFGFLDIAESVASNRKESILNPTAFIQEIERGVEDFKNHILKELIFRIIEQNKRNNKYMNANFEVISSPVKGFMTDKFRAMIRSFYDRGIISRQTAVEMGIEVPFEAEVTRIKREKKQGMERDLYPPIIQNLEQHQNADEINKDNISDDKKGIEKQNFNKSKMLDLETSPYTKLSELPEYIKKKSLKIRKKWMQIFNNAYFHKLGQGVSVKEAEKYAFKVANARIKRS